MKLWIRSQDKLSLIKVNRIEIFHHYLYKDTQEKYLLPSGSFEYRKVQKKDKYIKSEIVSNDEITLGTYKTKERALEVLDEIQKTMMSRKGILTTLNNKEEFIPFENQVVIYDMPKE